MGDNQGNVSSDEFGSTTLGWIRGTQEFDRPKQEGVMGNDGLALPVGGKLDQGIGDFETDGNTADRSGRITDLVTHIVPFVGKIGWSESVDQFGNLAYGDVGLGGWRDGLG
jgi:hypothetical protein